MPESELKAILRGWLGPRRLGFLDYYRFPGRRAAWGGPFNGQTARVELFQELTQFFGFAAIVETGTYLGTTTAFLAQSGLPVYTVESDPRNFGFASARLRSCRNANVLLGDSCETLEILLAGVLAPVCEQDLFFYLDAHWEERLPLAEELEVVFRHCRSAVVMIDDFSVPDDPGYAYDDYGPGRALDAKYIEPIVKEQELAVFYPATAAREESGARRGCVVLSRSNGQDARLRQMKLLREA